MSKGSHTEIAQGDFESYGWTKQVLWQYKKAFNRQRLHGPAGIYLLSLKTASTDSSWCFFSRSIRRPGQWIWMAMMWKRQKSYDWVESPKMLLKVGLWAKRQERLSGGCLYSKMDPHGLSFIHGVFTSQSKLCSKRPNWYWYLFLK